MTASFILDKNRPNVGIFRHFEDMIIYDHNFCYMNIHSYILKIANLAKCNFTKQN